MPHDQPAALRLAKEHGYTNLTVRSDSLLLVCQMRGEYKVKNPGLQALHGEGAASSGSSAACASSTCGGS